MKQLFPHPYRKLKKILLGPIKALILIYRKVLVPNLLIW